MTERTLIRIGFYKLENMTVGDLRERICALPDEARIRMNSYFDQQGPIEFYLEETMEERKERGAKERADDEARKRNNKMKRLAKLAEELGVTIA